MAVNHKRVARLMQEDHLLALRRKAWVATTNAGHELQGLLEPGAADGTERSGSALGGRYHVHPSVARVRLSGGGGGRVLPASGGVGAWSGAYKLAWRSRRWRWRSPSAGPLPGLVHHSDRGIQYASAEYASLAQASTA